MVERKKHDQRRKKTDFNRSDTKKTKGNRSKRMKEQKEKRILTGSNGEHRSKREDGPRCALFEFRVGRLGLRVQSIALLAIAPLAMGAAEPDPFTKREPPPIVGRWDLKVRGADGDYPSWLEIEQSGFRTLFGRYVGRVGSVRPIGSIDFEKDKFRFVVPPQWERTTNDFVFEGTLNGDVLRGQTTDDNGKPIRWEGRRAPALNPTKPPRWGKPIPLFNGRDLSGWKRRDPSGTNGWRVVKGVLTNVEPGPGNDLISEQTFSDFKLHAEFKYPKESNSGIYLRGRYEVQIEDNFGQEPDAHGIGGVYGFLSPRVNAARKADEWQTLDITLTGRVVTIVLNGEPVIERQAIPGITGGALDSDEGKPGPILVQGDHGRVEFRQLQLTPAE
jgi:hypothetical protein